MFCPNKRHRGGRKIGDGFDIGPVIHLSGEDDQRVGKYRMQLFELGRRVIKFGVDTIAERGHIVRTGAVFEQRCLCITHEQTGISTARNIALERP